ncbi:MAG: EthD family reductase [Chloroflexi bacterium]|nr:EthD family reductase [Chloroflexota bacterium]
MVRRVAYVARKPGISAEEFWKHYSGPHAAIVREMPGLRGMALSRPSGPQTSNWDAVGELWFDSADAMRAAFSDPAVAAKLAVDRPQFLGASEVVVVEEVLRWEPSLDTP